MTQTTGFVVKADQMREIAAKNPTAHSLLLYLALYDDGKTTSVLDLSLLKTELSDRGVNVDEQQLYDALQELEDLGLGSIIYAKRGSGTDDVFKRGYSLNIYAKRAFPINYLNQWITKIDHEDGEKVKLSDPNFKFKETAQEKTLRMKESSGKRGRPKGYSHALGRFFTPQEMSAREERKAHPKPRGRPTGWRKYPGQENGLRSKLSAMNKQSIGTGKRGRPKGYSHKLGRFMTAKELAAKVKVPGKRGRPMGWRKDPSKVVTATPKFNGSRPPQTAVMRANGAYRVLNIPLKNNRNIHIEIPKKLSSDEVALLKLNLDAII